MRQCLLIRTNLVEETDKEFLRVGRADPLLDVGRNAAKRIAGIENLYISATECFSEISIRACLKVAISCGCYLNDDVCLFGNISASTIDPAL